MKIPKKIKICGIDYDVITEKFDNESLYGTSNERIAKITLNQNVNGQVREETFLHEVVHVINWVSEVGLNEKQVSILSRLLYQALNDNDLIKG